jgi:hypothetical protein
LRALGLVVWAMMAAAPAEAWGDLGHKVTALIAYRHLLPQARARLDALLASDTDPLTAPDFPARATWADKYRTAHRETAAWHFVDIEIDHPDLASACFQDCVVNKIEQFTAELANSATTQAERLLALKYLIHFIGDLHQPLHAADHRDRGGNCIGLAPPIDQTANLHAYWDVAVVDALGPSAAQIADKLDASLDDSKFRAWGQGTPRSWALESFDLGRRDAYALPSRPTCQNGGSISLSGEYRARAEKDAAAQLVKAAARMASVLNAALADGR